MRSPSNYGILYTPLREILESDSLFILEMISGEIVWPALNIVCLFPYGDLWEDDDLPELFIVHDLYNFDGEIEPSPNFSYGDLLPFIGDIDELIT